MKPGGSGVERLDCPSLPFHGELVAPGKPLESTDLLDSLDDRPARPLEQ